MNRQFDYQQELDALHFTQEQKETIAARAAQAAQAQLRYLTHANLQSK